jgi:tetratricopeptide (TPR) repeat protein
MGDRLRPYWDFDDLDLSERRFRELLETETTDAGRAEVLTQLARVHGLRADFDEGERLIAEAEALAGDSPRARIRIDLELGRLRRSAGEPAAALPLFESAFGAAGEAGEAFLAADAAHMTALAAPDREGFDAWTRRGIDVAESEESARYWLGPLHNNLGWEQYEAGELEDALDSFERALAERDRDPANGQAIALARYAVSKALRALGRAADAVPHAESAVAWAESHGSPDGWFHEELAEAYAALDRNEEAARHASRALNLLPEAEHEPGRVDRLREIAASRG